MVKMIFFWGVIFIGIYFLLEVHDEVFKKKNTILLKTGYAIAAATGTTLLLTTIVIFF